MTKTNDVVYGILSSGRPSSVKNIDAIAGPLSNLIPVRFLIKEDEDIISCLNQVQKKQISTISYDFVSVQQIASYVHVKPEEIQKIIYERSFILVDTIGVSEDFSDNQLFNILYSDISLFHKVPFRGYGTLNEKIMIQIKFDAMCVNRGFVINFIEYMMLAIQAMVKYPSKKVKELRALPETRDDV